MKAQMANGTDYLRRSLITFLVCGWLMNVFFIFQFNQLGELRDKLIFGGSALLALLSYFYRDISSIYRNKFFSVFTLISFSVIAVTGILPIEHHEKTLVGVGISRFLWCGFGPAVFVALLLISMPFGASFLTEENKYGVWRKRLAALSIILVILSFTQEAITIIDQSHTEYIINEMFAFVSNNIPYVDFIPQYQSFYGLILVPFSGFLTSFELLEMAFVFLFVLSLFAIYLMVSLGRKCLPTKSWTTAVILIIPLIGVTPFGMRISFTGSIAALLSAYPIRLLPGLILITMFTNFYRAKHKIRKIDSFKYQVVVGCIAGIILLQQQDFGIAAVCSVFLAIFIEPTGTARQKIKIFSSISASSFIIAFAIIGCLSAATKGVNLDYLGFFNRQFSGGFGAELIELPGPAMVILPLMFSLLVLHLSKLRRGAAAEEFTDQSHLIAFTITVWMILCLPYYLNRSFASGQMQILLGLLGISITAALGQYINEIRETAHKHRYYKFSPESLYLRALVAFPLAVIMLLPNPAFDVYRIYKGTIQDRFPTQEKISEITEVRSRYAWLMRNDPKASIAYFGALGNYVQDATGVRSVNLFSSPNDWSISEKAFKLGCSHLKSNLPDYIYLDTSALGLFMNSKQQKCLLDIELSSNKHFYQIEKRGIN